MSDLVELGLQVGEVEAVRGSPQCNGKVYRV